jgi:hypothetical protein
VRDEVIEYLHLPVGSALPMLVLVPCRVVVLIEQLVSEEWQGQVSEWIVEAGCLYMMAWGRDCSSWDDSVDWASLKAQKDDEVPDDEFVMTTWHENESMAEVFEYCYICAHHPTNDLATVRIVDISAFDRRVEICEAYAGMKHGLCEEAETEPAKGSLTGWFNRLIKRA